MPQTIVMSPMEGVKNNLLESEELSIYFENHLNLVEIKKDKIDEFDEFGYSEESSFTIEKTVQLDVTELTALQRHKQSVSEYLKLHLELVPEFQDVTFLPGRKNNLTAIEKIKLQLIWVLLLKYLVMKPKTSVFDFTKLSHKQKQTYCKDLYKKLFPHLPKGNFDSEGICTFNNDLEIQNYYLHTQNLLENFFEVNSVEQLMQKIDENPHAQDFFDQLGCDDPDTLLLRFLRARKWNLIDATLMLIDTLNWHRSFGVRNVLCQGEAAVKEYLLTCGKHYAWNVDLKGRLVIWITSKLHDKNKQTLHENLVALVFLIEHSRRLMAPGTETVTLVFDLADAPLASLDLPSIQSDIQVLQNYYPECLGHCFIVDAPWIFHGIYRIVRGFLDPIVVSKIELIKSSEIIKHIHPSMVPKRYVGGCDPIDFVYTIEPETRIIPDLDINRMNSRLSKLRKELIRLTLIDRPCETFDPEGKRSSIRTDLKELTAKWEIINLPENHYHRCSIISKDGLINWNMKN